MVTLQNAGFGVIPRPTRALTAFDGETFYLVITLGDCLGALTERLNALLRLPLESLTAVELEVRAQAIHDDLVEPTERTSVSVRGHSLDGLLTPVANRHIMPPPHH